MYKKLSFLEALEKWEDMAKEEGCSRADLAYRWVAYNSALKPDRGDGVVIGVSRLQQVEQTLKWVGHGAAEKREREED